MDGNEVAERPSKTLNYAESVTSTYSSRSRLSSSSFIRSSSARSRSSFARSSFWRRISAKRRRSSSSALRRAKAVYRYTESTKTRNVHNFGSDSKLRSGQNCTEERNGPTNGHRPKVKDQTGQSCLRDFELTPTQQCQAAHRTFRNPPLPLSLQTRNLLLLLLDSGALELLLLLALEALAVHTDLHQMRFEHRLQEEDGAALVSDSDPLTTHKISRSIAEGEAKSCNETRPTSGKSFQATLLRRLHHFAKAVKVSRNR